MTSFKFNKIISHSGRRCHQDVPLSISPTEEVANKSPNSIVKPKANKWATVLAIALFLSTFALLLEGVIPTKALAARKNSESNQEYQMRQRMLTVSKQLGVTCIYCHNLKDFRDSSKSSFKISKEHMRVTNWLNSKAGLNGNPSIDCYHCHRGEARPKIHVPLVDH